MRQRPPDRALIAAALGTACLVLLVPQTGHGHHSFPGRFDREAFMELEGVITEIAWVNPHIYLDLEAVDGNGQRVVWEIETRSPTTLYRAGVRRDALSVGDRVRIGGFPPVTGKRELFATNVLVPSGAELLVGGPDTPVRWGSEAIGDLSFSNLTEGDPTRPELGIFRIWSHTEASPALIPENVQQDYDIFSYPLTNAALESVRSFYRVEDNPTRDCVPKGMPMIMEQPYPIQFVDDGDGIRLPIEEYDLVRTIDMVNESPPPEAPASPLGYSVGRWEDPTLVVTTTNISWAWFDQLGIPQSTEFVVVERFTPSADGSRLAHTVTVTDPVNFSKPVTLSRFWLYEPGTEILPFSSAGSVDSR